MMTVLLHPVAVSMKVKTEIPAVTPVTIPTSLTVAFPLLLVHVPPVAGVIFTISSTHTDVAPPIIGKAFSLTTTSDESLSVHGAVGVTT